MSENPRPRKSSLFKPLSGDETGTLDLLLTHDAAKSLEARLADVDTSDDYAFQSHLRFLSAMYYFLGGSRFDTVLAERLHVSQGSVNRWLNGVSAPFPQWRVKGLAAAEEIVRHLELKRRLGASLFDIKNRNED